MPADWSMHLGGARPPSNARVILADVLEAYCIDAYFMKPAEISAAFAETIEATQAERDRRYIRAAIARLGRLFLDGVLATFVRPLGGGPVARLPPNHWEVDDWEPRFATCLVDPARWWDAAAPGTHWILVDAPAFDVWLYENSADAFLRDPYVPPPAATGAPAPGASRGSETTSFSPVGPERFLRIEEVVKRSGLSRSTLYERIKAGSFPRQRTNGGRIVMWTETEVSAWQADQMKD